jgi:hypothetical protein
MKRVRDQNKLITNEFEKACSWHNNIKFIQGARNDYSTSSSVMKKSSNQIEEECEKLGKLIEAQLQQKTQQDTLKV